MHRPFQVLGGTLVAAVAANLARFQQPLFAAEKKGTNILNAEVDAAIASILEDFKTPGGVGVAFVRKQEDGSWDVETKGYGIAKADGTKLFDILATGLLISNESLSTPISWETKIASFVPEWGLMDPVASTESTIVDVMSHRTGLPRHDFAASLSDSVPDSIRRLRYLRPSTGFRDLWQYNNHMYTLLSYFPQLLVGVPFETYVHDFILEPLGMHSTTYFSGEAEASENLADGFARDKVNQTEDPFGQGIIRALPFWAPNKGETGDALSGAGGVISNANDLAIWLQALLTEGRNPTSDEVVIPADVIRRVASGVTVAAPVGPSPEISPVVYGGGQSRGTYRGFEFIEASVHIHGGSVTGFRSQITRIPSQNLGVAVLSNDESFGTEIVEAIKFRILDKALKLEPVVDWSSRFKSLIVAGLKGRTIPTPRPENATLPSVPFADLAGKYWDAGYGTIEWCLVAPEAQSLPPPSDSCRRIVEEIPTALPDVLDPKIPTLLAKWDGIGLAYASLAHYEHNTFNLSAFSSIPTGNSSDRPYWVTVFSDPSLQAEFSYDGILGCTMWSAGHKAKPTFAAI
ncbi:beta-lactamase/transpeptidase-like protein [Mycena galericulata]|nr:beta-lactamase/transpeptidase-like protein [Mycena galericulata]